MMHSVIEAIYDTYCTAAFQPPPARTPRVVPRRPHSASVQVRRPQPSLLTGSRKLIGHALNSLGSSLQISGDRLIGTHRAGSA